MRGYTRDQRGPIESAEARVGQRISGEGGRGGLGLKARKGSRMETKNDTNSTMATTSPFFHTARELAAYLGVDPVTVRRLMRRKAIPYIKVRGLYLFRRNEVDAFLERHTVHAVGMKRERMA